MLDDEAALAAIGSLTTLAKLLPERDPHPKLYARGLAVLRALDDARAWPALLVRWELLLLQDLGFGLDLSECAATGVDTDLAYVSPRSGRAVSRDGGRSPMATSCCKLPRFLVGGGGQLRRRRTCWRASRSPAISSSAMCLPRKGLPCRNPASA